MLSLSLIRTRFEGERTAEPHALHVEILEGLRWLWQQLLIRYMAFLTGGLNVGSAGSGLLLIALAKGQGADATTIGLIFSIASVGGIAGSMLAPRIQKRFGFGQVIIATCWVKAILRPMLAFMPNPLLLGVVTAGLLHAVAY